MHLLSLTFWASRGTADTLAALSVPPKGIARTDCACFPEINASLETDASFWNAKRKEHPNTDTILRQQPIDLIQKVP